MIDIGNGFNPFIKLLFSVIFFFRARCTTSQTAFAGAKYNSVEVRIPILGAHDSAIRKVCSFVNISIIFVGGAISSCVRVFLVVVCVVVVVVVVVVTLALSILNDDNVGDAKGIEMLRVLLAVATGVLPNCTEEKPSTRLLASNRTEKAAIIVARLEKRRSCCIVNLVE